jgi:hypothetical protein
MFQVLEVIEKKRSGKARKSIIKIGEKLILAPTYGTYLQKKFEMDLLCSTKIQEFSNIGIIASKIYLIENMIREREGRLGLMTLTGKSMEENYKDLKKEKIWIIDPCADEFYYKNEKVREGFSEIKEFSSEIKKLLVNTKEKDYNKLWNDINSDTTLFMKFIREFVKSQAKFKTDIILPPSPLITADSPEYIIDVWHKITKTTGVLAKTLAEKNSAILLNLHFNLFRRPEKLASIIKKLTDMSSEDTISEIKTIIIKIHGEDLESDTGETRSRFRSFINGITNFSSLTKRAFFILDTSSVGLACISLGADGFIEPLNGVIGNGIAFSKDKHGRYYHPDGLKYTRFKDLKEFYEHNNSNLPCHCSFCNNISGRNLDKEVPITEWNLSRRGHLLECRNSEIKEYRKTIDENTTSNAIIDKIQRSDIKNLLDILPK